MSDRGRFLGISMLAKSSEMAVEGMRSRAMQSSYAVKAAAAYRHCHEVHGEHALCDEVFRKHGAVEAGDSLRPFVG